jgi:glycosyltransferase involved in cell wall biosynthesis
MTVSVVVPTFERLDYLRPALDSVFAQTWPDWELIIADDGSGQDVQAYLSALEARPRVTAVRLPHTGNPAAVRNAGLRAATGTHVAFLDSDDLWAPRKLERQLATLGERRWGYTAFRRVDAAGRVLPEERTRPWRPHQGDIFGLVVTGAASIRTPSVLAERDLVTAAGGFDETLRSCEDYDLWMRLALRSPAAIVDEPLVDVRLHDRNHSLDWASAFHGRARSLAKLEAMVPAELRPLLRRERARNAAGLVAEHARRGERAAAARALIAGAAHAWRQPEWWWRVTRALVRR